MLLVFQSGGTPSIIWLICCTAWRSLAWPRRLSRSAAHGWGPCSWSDQPGKQWPVRAGPRAPGVRPRLRRSQLSGWVSNRRSTRSLAGGQHVPGNAACVGGLNVCWPLFDPPSGVQAGLLRTTRCTRLGHTRRRVVGMTTRRWRYRPCPAGRCRQGCLKSPGSRKVRHALADGLWTDWHGSHLPDCLYCSF
jgi:hypothetical protein